MVAFTLNGGMRVAQFFVVGDKTVALEGETEIVGGHIVPVLQACYRWMTVKTGIDLYAVELPAVMMQPLIPAYAEIKVVLPVGVGPAAGADIHTCRQPGGISMEGLRMLVSIYVSSRNGPGFDRIIVALKSQMMPGWRLYNVMCTFAVVSGRAGRRSAQGFMPQIDPLRCKVLCNK